MLHIHNGESSAGTLRQSAVPGESVAFKDALIDGPTPSGLTGDAWRSLRARHLSETYGVDAQESARGLAEQESVLASFAANDEVVLWFEPDLFCQVNLIYLLDWFSQRDLGNTKLSLICPDQFPGIEKFRGLGQLNADQLVSLLPTRQPVTPAHMSLAAAAWASYCSPDPATIAGFLSRDLSPLPFLGAALRAHLARFPALKKRTGPN